jgi:hypothetical protein
MHTHRITPVLTDKEDAEGGDEQEGEEGVPHGRGGKGG